MAGKKGPPTGGAEEQTREPLVAVLLADTYSQALWPVTIEQPLGLLNLAHAPLIEYTLEWLASVPVDEIVVLTTMHAQRIKEYIKASKWSRVLTPHVKILVAEDCGSVGDALRTLEQADIIKSDFILTAADVVTNMDLAPALEAHRSRRKTDKSCLMTVVCRGKVSAEQRIRMGIEPQSVLLEEPTKRVLYNDVGNVAALRPVPLSSAAVRNATHRTDLADVDIYVCAPEVLMEFASNFDYQNICQDFIAGVIAEEELGHKVHVYETADSAYCATVGNWRAYDAVTRDVLQRWAYPFSPDTNCLAANPARGPALTEYRQRRRNLYQESSTRVGLTTQCTRDSCIGRGSAIGDGTTVHCSVIGRECSIGENVLLSGSVVMDGAVVGDGARLECTLVCPNAVVREGAVLGPGCIVGSGVVIGTHHAVKKGTAVTLCRRDEGAGGAKGGDEWSEEGGAEWIECAPTDKVLQAARAVAKGAIFSDVLWDRDAVGTDGAGFSWHVSGRYAAPRYGLQPPTPALAVAWMGGLEAELAALEASRKGAGAEADDAASEGHGAGDDPEAHFKQEVVETFLRCVKERFELANVVVELNGLRLSENRSFVDCGSYIFTTILGLALPPPTSVRPSYHSLYPTEFADVKSKAGRMQLLAKVMSLMKEWGPLLKKFVKSEDDEVDMLLTLEELCGGEGVFEGSGEHGRVFAEVFEGLLQVLYHDSVDILTEEGILKWTEEKEHADKSERVYLDKCRTFIDFLRADDDDDDDEDDDEDSD